MDKSSWIVTPGLTPFLGYSLMIGIGVIFLVLANLIKNALVRNTHDFIIANRRIGLGFGVGTVISVWTWAMAVMMRSAMTFKWGLSRLPWFVVPKWFALLAMIPLARVLRRRMPEGYTISAFPSRRFGRSNVAAGVVSFTIIFGLI